MKGKKLIKELLAMREVSQRQLAERLNTNQSNITGCLNRGKHDMRIDLFLDMVKALDCEVVVRSTSGDGREWRLTEVTYDLDKLLSE